MGDSIKQLDTGVGPRIGRELLGVRPYDLTIVATVICAGCNRPHLVSIASSARNPDAVIGTLSMAILDILDTYKIVIDDEHRRHHE
jgi:hypothetical protein